MSPWWAPTNPNVNPNWNRPRPAPLNRAQGGMPQPQLWNPMSFYSGQQGAGFMGRGGLGMASSNPALNQTPGFGNQPMGTQSPVVPGRNNLQGSNRTAAQNWESVFGFAPDLTAEDAFRRQGTPLGPVDPAMLEYIKNWKEPTMPAGLTPGEAYAWRYANTSTADQYYKQHPKEKVIVPKAGTSYSYSYPGLQ